MCPPPLCPGLIKLESLAVFGCRLGMSDLERLRGKMPNLKVVRAAWWIDWMVLDGHHMGPARGRERRGGGVPRNDQNSLRGICPRFIYKCVRDRNGWLEYLNNVVKHVQRLLLFLFLFVKKSDYVAYFCFSPYWKLVTWGFHILGEAGFCL